VLLASLLVFLSQHHVISTFTTATELDNSIQLLTQVLTPVVAVLFIGTTLYLTSYDRSELLASIDDEIEKTIAPVQATFLGRGLHGHKVNNPTLVHQLFDRLALKALVCEGISIAEATPYYILRPNWDGV